MNTATNNRDWQVRRWLQAGLLVSCALYLGAPLAQGGAPRADVPTLKVGDRWKFEQIDRRTGLKESELERKVTSVTATQIEGTENDGKFVLTADLNTLETSTLVATGDTKAFSFPLEVGKKWEYKFSFANKLNPGKGRRQLEAHVVAYEKVKVPAGEFDAFRIEYSGFWNSDSNRRPNTGRLTTTNWYAPAARGVVKVEFDDGSNKWVRQLVEIALQP